MRNRVTFCLSALIILGALLTIGSTSVYADVPDSIHYQGILKTSGGSPAPDALYGVIFRIYDVASGPDPALWTEAKSVTTVDGLFTTFLGSGTPLPHSVFSEPKRFLGITMEGDVEMTPRTAIVAVPYAYRIATVDGATGGSINGDVAISSGSIDLDASSTTSGNILKGGVPFIHDFGTLSTFIGRNAGNLTMSGGANTACGSSALLSNTSGTANTACGTQTLHDNTTGSFNTASGLSALYSNTTGSQNSACGDNALVFNTTGSYNTASGSQALYSNTTGRFNTASGREALHSNTTGISNTAIGDQALYFNTTGNDNTASGLYALGNNTTGIQNTTSGISALALNVTGNNNTANGWNALFDNTTGSNNTAVGYLANVASGALTNATAIGANAVVSASNKVRLGNSAVTVIEGQVAYTFPSDKNQKENFCPVDGDEVLRKLRGLNLTSWNYIGHDPEQFRHYGPVAQEFFAAFGHDGVGTSGTPTTINSGDLAGILMIAVQALDKRTSEVEDLRAQIAELREMISERR